MIIGCYDQVAINDLHINVPNKRCLGGIKPTIHTDQGRRTFGL